MTSDVELTDFGLISDEQGYAWTYNEARGTWSIVCPHIFDVHDVCTLCGQKQKELVAQRLRRK